MEIGRACQPFPLLPPQLMRYCGSKDADLIEASSAKTVFNIGLHAAATYHEHKVKIRYNFEAVWLGPVSPEPELASAYVEYAPSANPVASRKKIRRISINVRHKRVSTGSAADSNYCYNSTPQHMKGYWTLRWHGYSRILMRR
jgi:hypothetical protein